MTKRGRTADDTEAASFSAALEDFARAARKMRARVYPGEVLSAGRYSLVAPLLTADEPLPVGELAAAAGVTAATSTVALDGLERDGVIMRVRDTRDRRLVRIGLTESGRRLVEAQAARTEDRRRRVYESLEPSERAEATRLLLRLAAVFDELR